MTVAAQKGNLVVVSTSSGGGSPTYTPVTSARATSLTVNKSQVDVTTITSGGVKTLLAGAGITSFSISLSGAFEDSSQDKVLQAAAFAVPDAFLPLKLSCGNGDTYIGTFAVTSYKVAGTYNGEQTYDLSLDSSGAVTFTPGT
jgi:TP901-1 family phage major tail protein